jgi:hypothetical protein
MLQERISSALWQLSNGVSSVEHNGEHGVGASIASLEAHECFCRAITAMCDAVRHPNFDDILDIDFAADFPGFVGQHWPKKHCPTELLEIGNWCAILQVAIKLLKHDYKLQIK